ncbi:DNA primase [Candidatus Vidania fulgoroideae]|uniref:DNA primase n=1 Tax=Candidatus Vidania fulgoroideorum TaxID=881286 RepID=A0A346E0F5_9PROT|nr:DNA primase [Candidatus Vidania fulgoroideae]
MNFKNIYIYIKSKKTYLSDLDLKKINKNKVISICPFHIEKKESFLLNIDKMFYYCFGCKKSGKIFLDKKIYFNIEKYIFFTKKMLSNFDSIDFLKKKRIFNIFSIYEFKIGFVKNYLDFYNFFKNNYLEKKLFFLLKNKIFFPVTNTNGKVVSVIIRNISNNKFSKYIFFPINKNVKKKNILYGLFQNKFEILKKNYVFIVEGCTDLISMHSKNIKNVVSTLGSNLEVNHFKILSKICKNFIIFYDNDKAGKEAIRRFYYKNKTYIEKKNFFVLLTKEKDPNEYFLKNDKKNFIKIFKKNILKIEEFVSTDKENKYNKISRNILENPLKYYKEKTRGKLYFYKIKKTIFSLLKKISNSNIILIKDYKFILKKIIFLNNMNEKI